MGSPYPTNRPSGVRPPLDPKSPRSELSLSLHRSRGRSFLRPILPPLRRHRSPQARGQEGDQAPDHPVHVGEIVRILTRPAGIGQNVGQYADDELEPPMEL